MTRRLFENKVCLVTGGTRGIGRAISLSLAEKGARLAISYHSDSQAAEETAALLDRIGADYILLKADISVPSEAKALPSKVVERFHGLDILVNNAGKTFDGAFAAMNPKEYESVIDTNLVGALQLSLTATAYLKQSRGSIVMISSLASISGKEGQTPYAASKGGLNALTRILARRLGPSGVHVNAVAPGFIRTDMMVNLPESSYRHVVESTSLKRIGESHEVANVVCFLASAEASYLNGTVLRLDGGFNR